MSAHTLVSTLQEETLIGLKKAVVTITGSASYDAGGSLVDLSTIFKSKVYGVAQIAVSPHGSAKYRTSFIRGASDGAALGKVKIHDITAASGAEASGDLSATTFTLEVTGV
jgi:hypothetical protein